MLSRSAQYRTFGLAQNFDSVAFSGSTTTVEKTLSFTRPWSHPAHTSSLATVVAVVDGGIVPGIETG